MFFKRPPKILDGGPPTLASIGPSLGDTAGGIPVLLTGTFLGPPTAVTINGVACTQVSVSVDRTQLACLTPALPAGSYDVAVTTAEGTATLVAGFQSFYPDTIAGIRIYDSTRGVVGNPVTQWTDQGGGGEDLTIALGDSGPALMPSRFGVNNSRPSLAFAGGTNQLTLAAPVPFVARSVFAAVKWAQLNLTGEVVAGSNGGADASFIDFALDSTGAMVTMRQRDSGSAVNHRSPDNPELQDGSARVIGSTTISASGDLKFYIGTTQQGPTLNDTPYAGAAAWDRVGNGGGNPFIGEVGAVCVAERVLTAPEQLQVVTWMYGKWVARLAVFMQVNLNPPWFARDGAGLLALNGALYMLGGWNAQGGGAFAGGNKTTNEVWKSTDGGATWANILAMANPAPPNRWSTRHSAGWCVHGGLLYVIGSDIYNGPVNNTGTGSGTSDVWSSPDGVTWTLVTNAAPWGPRFLHFVTSFEGSLYLMGGQTVLNDPTTALNDVWTSGDGGVTWTQLANAPWAIRSSIVSPLPVFGGKLWVMGGGALNGGTPALGTFLHDVWSFDGVAWVNATAAAPWQGRQYPCGASVADLDGSRLYLLDGSALPLVGDADAKGNIGDVWSSADGATWTKQTIVPWLPSHADGIAVLGDVIVKGPGNGDIGEPIDPGTATVYSVAKASYASP